MPPSKEVRIERMVKRVDNAIHNPSVDYNGVREALEDLKANTIRIFRDDYTHWIHLAIQAKNEKKLRCLFTMKQTGLSSLFKHNPESIPLYVSSDLFNPNEFYSYAYMYDEMILRKVVAKEHLPSIHLFFKQSKTYPILLRLIEGGFITKKEQNLYMSINPVFRRKKQARKTLLRFWLLTAKPAIRNYKESLYAPGTGALYKKAEASFYQTSP
jgi:predicted KAP-like P-loop ATPase